MPKKLKNLEPIYIDNHLIVVVKPAGILSQGDSTGDLSILDWAKEWTRREFSKLGNVYMGLVHRLDRPVGGVMVMARTSKAASRLSQQFRERRVSKTYQAIVLGRVQNEFGRLTGVVDGKNEELEYRILERYSRHTSLSIVPKTGRKHQIRRQLSELGHPVTGDLRYGAASPLPNRQIALFAVALEFEHPTRKAPICFTAKLPDWWPTELSMNRN